MLVLLGFAGGAWASTASLRYGHWVTFLVWFPSLVPVVLGFPVLSMKFRTHADSALLHRRPLVISIASSVGGAVFVALAVLVATVDAAAWEVLASEGRIGPLVLAPLYTWSATLALVVWVYLGCLLHAFAPTGAAWDPLRETAAVLTVGSVFLLPVGFLTVGFQMWSLVDVAISSTRGGG